MAQDNQRILLPHERHKLKKFIKNIENHRGRHTELVSVYVPSGYALTAIINHLSQEQGTASNIKSTSTRKNVTDALERMIQHLRIIGKTPPNGLACFSGNVSEREGQSDVQVWSIEPPIPVNLRLYRCDKEFVLDHLRDMCDTRQMFGLIVMDRREGTIALLRGKSIEIKDRLTSAVPGKTRAGGQSAKRFESLRDIAANDFYKRIGSSAQDAFWDLRGDLKGILLGGPGPTKYTFQDGAHLPQELKDKIISVQDLSYSDEFGCQELIEKSQDILASEEVAEEKRIMAVFFKHLAKNTGLVSYGVKDVQEKLDMGAVDTILISEVLDDELSDQLEEKAEEMGSKIQFISIETMEGQQLRDMGKLAAILRYKVDEY